MRRLKVETRAVHESGQLKFGSDPYSTRLGWVTENLTRTQPNIQVGPTFQVIGLVGQTRRLGESGFQIGQVCRFV